MGGYLWMERDAVRVYLNDKVVEAEAAMERDFDYYEKTVQLEAPYVYERGLIDPWYDFQDPEYYGVYWYHPDHLGSSSYITNEDGEINQHLECLPFGELLVEEHLSSYNSPFKFNAKERDTPEACGAY